MAEVPVNAGLTADEPPKQPTGWLHVLALLLIFVHPLSFALSASAALEALPLRGAPLAALLALHLLVTALGLAAGVSLLNGRPGGITLAGVAMLAAAVTDMLIYATPWYPNNRMPGDTPLYVVASLLYYGGWLMYLWRSRRTR